MSPLDFYEALARTQHANRLTATLEGCQELIDSMEDLIPHGHLPGWYDELVRRRDRLLVQRPVPGQRRMRLG